MELNPHSKQATFEQIRRECVEEARTLIADFPDRPRCPDCGELMIKMAFEDPEAGWWHFWACACQVAFKQNQAGFEVPDAEISVWSQTVDRRKEEIGLPTAFQVTQEDQPDLE